MTEDVEMKILSKDECWALLGERNIGRLGVNVGNHPDIFPVNYVIHRGDIVVRTEPGTKLSAALMGHHVAFEIDSFDDDERTGWSVVVHGIARESRTLGSVIRDQELPIEPWAGGRKTRHLRITPTRVTGRTILAR